ncbi:hypothetical protein [Candidatus Vondammii sp. HM_W22]|uniref:hypothetical protein n=1 Tax=Candidatus Vondammii sp. HM_W22 TaxID=2687299 RepID=UPI001F14706C|nr:hypothetical protein [Candidatus Vondammii sp. HM_W22]
MADASEWIANLMGDAGGGESPQRGGLHLLGDLGSIKKDNSTLPRPLPRAENPTFNSLPPGASA